MKKQNTLNVIDDKDKRVLLYFSILHTEADLGKMGASVRKLSLQRMGLTGVKQKEDIISMIWQHIEHYCHTIQIPFERVFLYQDGLPVCGKESEIVHDMAQSGSRNHKLLTQLMKQGATIMGTESPDLLLEEYHLMRHLLESLNNPKPLESTDHQSEKSQSLLNQRDQFIANQINQTLKTGFIGILFLGMLHDIAPYLAGDIQIHYPLKETF